MDVVVSRADLENSEPWLIDIVHGALLEAMREGHAVQRD